ncbi:hypothetical protein CEXT_610921 [Caerostris extrusa]|uniref:Uncharacterized protein n=1 Tax=Caerostris extrusa TaxID=172846 RepID=A0AAV4NLU8_CAEEX|nr:hypothetical protein CEXT_610921 [Caerostris extrusa]
MKLSPCSSSLDMISIVRTQLMERRAFMPAMCTSCLYYKRYFRLANDIGGGGVGIMSDLITLQSCLIKRAIVKCIVENGVLTVRWPVAVHCPGRGRASVVGGGVDGVPVAVEGVEKYVHIVGRQQVGLAHAGTVVRPAPLLAPRDVHLLQTSSVGHSRGNRWDLQSEHTTLVQPRTATYTDIEDYLVTA